MGRKKITEEEKDLFIKGVFKDLLPLIESGLTIEQALNEIGVERSRFYRFLTPIQKSELQLMKTTNTIYGQGSNGYSCNR